MKFLVFQHKHLEQMNPDRIRKEVLIVDDNNPIRHLLGTILAKHYEVTTLHDGLEAFAWLMKGNLPDVVLLDINMPRMDGLGFLTNLRHSGFFRHIPVVVISAIEDPDMKGQCEHLGIRQYLSKPFNPIQLRQMLESLLEYPVAVSAN